MASNSKGERFCCSRGTCSPWELVLQLRVSFQGQIFGSVPAISPVRNISVESRWCFSSQESRWEKQSRPITHPQANSNKISTCMDLAAPRIGAYIPSNRRIKLPEIPGKIIAQMAMEPASRTLVLVGSISNGCNTVIK